MKFNEAVHTIEARGAQIDRITDDHPSAILMGSVARHAILGQEAPIRTGRFNNKVRDLDFTSTEGALDFTEADQTPFPVDDLLTGLITVDSERDIATVTFEPTRPDVAVELPGSVFDPYPIKVGGIQAQTFHPDVMRRLHLILNSNRPKDKRNRATFESELSKLDYPTIPDSTFQPLHELGSMVLADPELRRRRTMDRMQEIYSDAVPDFIRSSLKPAMQVLKKTSVVTSRYD